MDHTNQRDTQEQSAFQIELDRLQQVYWTQIEEIQAAYEVKTMENLQAYIAQEQACERNQSPSVVKIKLKQIFTKDFINCNRMHSQYKAQRQAVTNEFLAKIIALKKLKAFQVENASNLAKIIAQEELQALEIIIVTLKNPQPGLLRFDNYSPQTVALKTKQITCPEFKVIHNQSQSIKNTCTQKIVQTQTEKQDRKKQMGAFGFIKKIVGFSTKPLSSCSHFLGYQTKKNPVFEQYKQQEEQTQSFMVDFSKYQKEKKD